MIEVIKEKLSAFPQKTILDVGTGKGEFIKDLKGLFPGYDKIIEIDPDKTSIQIAQGQYMEE